MLSFFKSLPQVFARSAVKPTAPRVLFMQSFRNATSPLAKDNEEAGSRLLITPSNGEVAVKFTSESHGVKFKGKDQLILERIVTMTPGQGHGNEAMEILTAIADEHDVQIGMFMEPIAHKALEMDALMVWAARHGFEEYHMPPGLYWREPHAGGGPRPTNG
jgi:hypothetical protein